MSHGFPGAKRRRTDRRGRSSRKSQFSRAWNPHRESDKLLEIMDGFMHRLAGVAQVLGVSRQRLRDRKPSSLSLTERERGGVMQATVSEVSTRSDVVPRPNGVGVERKQPLRPVPITAN